MSIRLLRFPSLSTAIGRAAAERETADAGLYTAGDRPAGVHMKATEVTNCVEFLASVDGDDARCAAVAE